MPDDSLTYQLRLAGDPGAEERIARLRSFAEGPRSRDALPWSEALDGEDRRRLRCELAQLLDEPLGTGEPHDWPEIMDLLQEYAALAGWEGALLPEAERAPALYAVDLRPQDGRAAERALAAVRGTVRELLTEFLPYHPTERERLARGSLKKLPDRDIWQIALPDGFRLRYFVDEQERVVYVVYLGPHPDGEENGRERDLLAWVRRRRHERNLGRAAPSES